MRDDVVAEAGGIGAAQDAALVLINNRDAGLVVQLIVPAPGFVEAAQIMHKGLRLARQRQRTHHTELDLEGVEHHVVLADKAHAAIQPAGIGSVVLDHLAGLGIGRREGLLAGGQTDVVLAILTVDEGQDVHHRQQPARHALLIFVALQIGRQPADLQTAGVLIVGIAEQIVFEHEGEGRGRGGRFVLGQEFERPPRQTPQQDGTRSPESCKTHNQILEYDLGMLR